MATSALSVCPASDRIVATWSIQSTTQIKLTFLLSTRSLCDYYQSYTNSSGTLLLHPDLSYLHQARCVFLGVGVCVCFDHGSHFNDIIRASTCFNHPEGVV
jgi:hypothetical protein